MLKLCDKRECVCECVPEHVYVWVSVFISVRVCASLFVFDKNLLNF